jgi:hypothetical protein
MAKEKKIMRTLVYRELASRHQAWQTCTFNGIEDWAANHKEFIEKLMENLAPSGSGFNSGTKLDFERSELNRLVLTTSFEHMDEFGGYDKTTDHDIIVKASLVHGIRIVITGRDWNGIKDYMREVMYDFLEKKIEVTGQDFQEVEDVVTKDNSVG